MHDNDPIRWFREWFDEANELPQANAMVLATAATQDDGQVRPSARMVLLKNQVAHDFWFFTHYDSRKARELGQNPAAQLLFYWPALGKQIRVEGTVSRLSVAESDRYFNERPLGSRYGAIASQQSKPLPSRAILEAAVRAVEDTQGATPKRPDYWGGYALTARRFEFWSEGEFRLHERTVFEKKAEATDPSNQWDIFNLWP